MSQIVTKFITDLAVTTAKINAGAVTDAKVASGIDAAKIGAGTVSNTEFGYLDGVTSAIQGQVDAKIAKSQLAAKGDLISASAAATPATLSVGTNGQVLSADSTQASGLRWITLSSTVFGKESKTLIAGDITNQYIDLAQVIIANSLDFMVNGLIFNEGVDYSVSLTGGVGGKTRVSFLGDLATAGAAALVAGDVVYVKYNY